MIRAHGILSFSFVIIIMFMNLLHQEDSMDHPLARSTKTINIFARFFTLRAKMALFIVVLLLVTATLFSLLTIQSMNRHILEEVIKRAESLCKSTAALAPYSLLSGDLLGTDNIVSKVKSANADIEYVAITNPEMKILAHTEVAKRGETYLFSPRDLVKGSDDGMRVYEVQSPADRLIEVVAPIVFDNKLMGHVVIGINKSVLYHAKAETRRSIAAGFGITMILGVLLFLVGLGLVGGASWARWTAIFLIAVNLIEQLGWLGHSQYPLWTLTVITLQIIVLFALTARWSDSGGME